MCKVHVRHTSRRFSKNKEQSRHTMGVFETVAHPNERHSGPTPAIEDPSAPLAKHSPSPSIFDDFGATEQNDSV